MCCHKQFSLKYSEVSSLHCLSNHTASVSSFGAFLRLWQTFILFHYNKIILNTHVFKSPFLLAWILFLLLQYRAWSALQDSICYGYCVNSRNQYVSGWQKLPVCIFVWRMLTHMKPVQTVRIKAVSGTWLWILGHCKYGKIVVTKPSWAEGEEFLFSNYICYLSLDLNLYGRDFKDFSNSCVVILRCR